MQRRRDSGGAGFLAPRGAGSGLAFSRWASAVSHVRDKWFRMVRHSYRRRIIHVGAENFREFFVFRLRGRGGRRWFFGDMEE